MPELKTSDKGINLIKSFEGLRLDAYYDAVGVLTIGYGHTGPDVVFGQEITPERADELLRADLARFEKGVNSLVIVPLSQNRFDALVSLTFNIGLTAFRRSTLLKLLNGLDYQGAGAQFTRWNKASGKVLAGLTRRREAERALFNEQVEERPIIVKPQPEA